MNVNSNIITNSKSSYKNLGVSEQVNQKQEFKTVLDGQQYRSRSLINENATLVYNGSQSMDKTNIETPDKTLIGAGKDNTCETAGKGLVTKDLVDSNDNNELEEKIINFVEIAVKTLQKNTEEPSKEVLSSEKATEEPEQIQQVLQLLSFIFENIDKTLVPQNDNIGFNSTKLEQLVGGEKLPSDTKNMLEDNISRIGVLLEKSMENNKITPQILNVLQNLTTQVHEVKRDLNLSGDFYQSNNLTEKIMNFVDGASNQLRQNAVSPSKELVGNDNSTEDVAQIQWLLESLSSIIQSTYEKPLTIHQGNDVNPINIEKLVGVEKLPLEIKSILKNNLNEIVDLLEKGKVNKEIPTKIIDVIKGLNTQIAQVNGDLNLFKSAVDESLIVESETTVSLGNITENSKLEEKIINFVEIANNALKQNIKSSSKELVENVTGTNEEVTQIQELLESLSSIIQNIYEKPVKLDHINEINPIVIEKLVGEEKLSPEIKVILKNNISEIVNLVKELKGKDDSATQLIDVIQKLTSEIKVVNGDLRLLKSLSFQSVGVISEDKLIKENQLTDGKSQITKTTSEILPINQMLSSTDIRQGNKSSGNSSFEEKFLNNLLGDNKDEMKISKAVSFMNQFETLKNVDTPGVITSSNLVINKNSIEVDVIKNIKFMELSGIKNLTVKMNPKELGEITIKLTMESGMMKASLSAQNKETFNLLNQNVQDITDRLKNMDIKIQSLDINIYEDSTFFGKDSSHRNNSGKQSNNTRTNMGIDEEDLPVINNYGFEENQVNKFV